MIGIAWHIRDDNVIMLHNRYTTLLKLTIRLVFFSHCLSMPLLSQQLLSLAVLNVFFFNFFFQEKRVFTYLQFNPKCWYYGIKKSRVQSSMPSHFIGNLYYVNVIIYLRLSLMICLSLIFLSKFVFPAFVIFL